MTGWSFLPVVFSHHYGLCYLLSVDFLLHLEPSKPGILLLLHLNLPANHCLVAIGKVQCYWPNANANVFVFHSGNMVESLCSIVGTASPVLCSSPEAVEALLPSSTFNLDEMRIIPNAEEEFRSWITQVGWNRDFTLHILHQFILFNCGHGA